MQNLNEDLINFSSMKQNIMRFRHLFSWILLVLWLSYTSVMLNSFKQQNSWVASLCRASD